MRRGIEGYSRGGFTLIEMLVVVLIIGILASIALPQYQKAVEKARWTEMVTIGNALADAEEVYWLQYREYAGRIADLDVKFSLELTNNQEGTIKLRNTEHGYASVEAATDAAGANGQWNGGYVVATYPELGVLYVRVLAHSNSQTSGWDTMRGKRLCDAYRGTEKGKEFCSSLGTPVAFNGSASGERYWLMD